MDLEPVGPPAVPAARLGHPHTEALFQPTRLARGSVALVNDANIVVFALWDHCLVVAEPAKEALAALTSEGPEVEAGSLLVADPAQLVLEAVHVGHRLRCHCFSCKLMLVLQIRDHASAICSRRSLTMRRLSVVLLFGRLVAN